MIGKILLFSLFFLSPQKLINISSEVVNIHIIPTQSKHFQTTYTKKVFFFCESYCQVLPVFLFWWFYLVHCASIDSSLALTTHWRSNSVLMSGVTSMTAFGFTARFGSVRNHLIKHAVTYMASNSQPNKTPCCANYYLLICSHVYYKPYFCSSSTVCLFSLPCFLSTLLIQPVYTVSKGEENLLIPVHAYPVIDELHIPPQINLPAVVLGQRCVCVYAWNQWFDHYSSI